MKVTKYLHSCLLLEDKGKVILIDPGVFTYNENALPIDKLSQLDYILITHNHSDHCHPPLIKELLAKFPSAQVLTNDTVGEALAKENIPFITLGNEDVSFRLAKHEKILDMPEGE